MLPWPSAIKLGLEYSSEAKERRGTEVGGCEGEDMSVCVSITSLLLWENTTTEEIFVLDLTVTEDERVYEAGRGYGHQALKENGSFVPSC